MDALSETLRVVRVTDAVFTYETLGAPWRSPAPSASTALPAEADAESRAVFHMIVEGECFVEIEGQPTLRLVAGDVVLFPNGRAHRMTSAPELPCAATARQSCEPPPLPDERTAPDDVGAVTRLICGRLLCDPPAARLLFACLPPVVRVGIRESRAAAWLESSVAYALGETRSPSPGSAGMLAKLAELLFIEVLRLHMNACDAQRTGWLAGVADRTVGAALAWLHKQPARAWTLSELARAAGTSRSVLAERFRQRMGTTPMQYLTQWRMLLASNLLRHSNTPLTRVAEKVGYQTDTAFIRAFRREFGASPAAWRRSDRAIGRAADALPEPG